MNRRVPLPDLFNRAGVSDPADWPAFAAAVTGRSVGAPEGWSVQDFRDVRRALVDGIGEDKCEVPS